MKFAIYDHKTGKITYREIETDDINKDMPVTLEDRLLSLEKEQLLNVSCILELDFRVLDLELATLTTNFNIKGDLKNMARTPYIMMKTLILAGEFDESDMKNKITVYHKANKITTNEKDELLALIEASNIAD